MFLSLVGSIDRAAYCPGETVFITSNVQNQSTRDMSAMKAKIVQTVDYKSSRKTKHITHVIAKMDGKLTRKAVAKLFCIKAHAIRTMSNIYDRALLQKWLTAKHHELLSKSNSIVYVSQDQVSVPQKCINTQIPVQNPVKHLGWKVLRRSILDV